MNKFTETFNSLILVAIVVFIGATLGGSILYLLYPSLLEFFPTAVSSGVLAPILEWWTAVKIVWIFNILVKSTPTSPSSKSTSK